MATKVAPLIVILGPTASGKTSAGIELAKQIGGEIICADSRTVYIGMDIGTAKPLLDEQRGIKHHLLDVVVPNQRFSVADFKDLAHQKADEIWARGKWPIMVGGTGLYIDSVIFDYQFSSSEAEKDPENTRHLLNSEKRDQKLRDNCLTLGIKMERDVLRVRVEARVEQMFSDGFIEEVKQLSDKYGWDNESMSGIGYRVAREFIEGRASEEDAKNAFVSRDMSLAKRQMTWFKRNRKIEWFERTQDLIERATDFSDQFKV